MLSRPGPPDMDYTDAPYRAPTQLELLREYELCNLIRPASSRRAEFIARNKSRYVGSYAFDEALQDELANLEPYSVRSGTKRTPLMAERMEAARQAGDYAAIGQMYEQARNRALEYVTGQALDALDEYLSRRAA